MGKLRYNLDIVKSEFDKRGYKLLDTEYIQSKHKMKYICLKHEDMGIQMINLNNLLNNHGCKYCANESRKKINTIDPLFVKSEFESFGYTLLDNYESFHKKMRFICLDHKNQGEQLASYHSLTKNINNIICFHCLIQEGNNRNMTIEYAQQEFTKVGFTLLETEYVNNKHPMQYICSKHPNNVQTIKWNNFVTGGGCYYCGRESTIKAHLLTYDFVKNAFEEKGYVLLEETYISHNTPMAFRCLIHKENGIQYAKYTTLQQGYAACKYCVNENTSGKNHYNWKGGISELTKYLRQKLIDWKKDSMKASNYKCVISGERFDDIHHLYSFNLILQEAFEITNLPIFQQIKDYSLDELKLLEDVVVDLHKKNPLGVCLSEDIHSHFHSVYGYGNNTPEQFEEYKRNKLIEYKIGKKV